MSATCFHYQKLGCFGVSWSSSFGKSQRWALLAGQDQGGHPGTPVSLQGDVGVPSPRGAGDGGGEGAWLGWTSVC